MVGHAADHDVALMLHQQRNQTLVLLILVAFATSNVLWKVPMTVKPPPQYCLEDEQVHGAAPIRGSSSFRYQRTFSPYSTHDTHTDNTHMILPINFFAQVNTTHYKALNVRRHDGFDFYRHGDLCILIV